MDHLATRGIDILNLLNPLLSALLQTKEDMIVVSPVPEAEKPSQYWVGALPLLCDTRLCSKQRRGRFMSSNLAVTLVVALRYGSLQRQVERVWNALAERPSARDTCEIG